MELFENDIRQRCENSIAFLEEITRLNKDRNLVFFLQQIQEEVIEIMYTSDSWFLAINSQNDKLKSLLHNNSQMKGMIQEISNELEYDSGPNQSKNKSITNYDDEE